LKSFEFRESDFHDLENYFEGSISKYQIGDNTNFNLPFQKFSEIRKLIFRNLVSILIFILNSLILIIQMKNDKSLLNLEKVLESFSTDERILNKFKFKPNMDVSEIKKDSSSLGNFKEFLQKFKKSNDELLNDQKALKELNIETQEENTKERKRDKTYIQMNLGLGILEQKEKDEIEKDNGKDLLYKIISSKKDEPTEEFINPIYDNQLDQKIINFLLQNKTKKRRRIHFIKKNSLY